MQETQTERVNSELKISVSKFIYFMQKSKHLSETLKYPNRKSNAICQ